MKIVNRNPEFLSIGWVVSQLPPRIPPRIQGLSAAFFIKAACKLLPDGTALPNPEGPLPPLGDMPTEGKPELGVEYSSDFVPFKPQGEFTLIGDACSPGGTPRSSFPVSAQVGSLRKSMLALGPRQWRTGLLTDSPGPALPVASVPLNYSNAWGGKDWLLNPLGRGIDTLELPQLELPGTPVEHRRSRVSPAGFAPIPRDWEQRHSKTGSYGGAWTEERWPWLPDDFDYSYFNAAPMSQWTPEYWRGDEELVFENLHPEHAIFRSRLPGLQARCFVTRPPLPDREPALEELTLVLDTISIDMNKELVVLIWRGRCPVQTIKLPDIDKLLFLTEPLDTPRQADAVYLEMLEEGLNPKPPSPGPPISVPNITQQIALEIAQAQKRMFDLKTEAFNRLIATLEERKPLFQQLASEEAHYGPKSQEAFATLKSLDPSIEIKDGPPEGPDDPPPEPMPDADAAKAHAEAVQAQKRKEADALETSFAPIRRRDDYFKEGKLDYLKVLNEGVENVDMSGVDFSGLDLPGVNFRGARLSEALFVKSKLFGADFTSADLTKANLSGADLTSANFSDADLTGCTVVGTQWKKCFLKGAHLPALNLEGADFSGAIGPYVDFSKANLSSAILVETQFPCGDFSGATVDRVDFSRANLTFGDFRSTSAKEAIFVECDLTNLRAGEKADFTGADLRRTKADDSIWEKSRLGSANFQQASLNRARFCEAQADRAGFDRCHLTQANFEDAFLTSAQLTNANLLRAVIDRADLTGANLDGSNLYEVSFWETILLHATWRNAFIKRTRLELI